MHGSDFIYSDYLKLNRFCFVLYHHLAKRAHALLFRYERLSWRVGQPSSELKQLPNALGWTS